MIIKKNFFKIKLALIVTIFLILFSNSVYAETLSGVVINRLNQPMPGLTVSLVHPNAGRSYPSTTDNIGRFFFSNVPLVPPATGPFYLEIYWGNQLLYRNTVVIRGNVTLPPIYL